MGTELEGLRVLQVAEGIADGIWEEVVSWDAFGRDVVGKQLVRSLDSIGANIAEAYGRFHYGEKLRFLYYARGSLFEAKYWIKRALVRDMISSSQAEAYASDLTALARRLKAFANSLKAQRSRHRDASRKARESSPKYVAESPDNLPKSLFTKADLRWLQSKSVSNP